MEFDRMTPDERGALNRYVNMLKGYISPMLHERAIIAANAELTRLREAIEWALSYKHNCIAYPDEWFAELRRRASGEGRVE